MSFNEFKGPPYLARRALYSEQMTVHAKELDWLIDPSLIPRSAAFRDDTLTGNPYVDLAYWMIERLTEWSVATHDQLSYEKVYERHGLSEPERVITRRFIAEGAQAAFEPGITAMGQTFSAVPPVAVRDGVDRSLWPAVAYEARKFGAGLAADGTNVQVLIRNYLGDTPTADFNPAKLKLDPETGIATVTPLADIIKYTKAAIKRHMPGRHVTNTCIALHAPLHELGGQTMFDATWRAYGTATETYIYPEDHIDRMRVPAQLPPDDHIEENMNRVAQARQEQALLAQQIGKIVGPEGFIVIAL